MCSCLFGENNLHRAHCLLDINNCSGRTAGWVYGHAQRYPRDYVRYVTIHNWVKIHWLRAINTLLLHLRLLSLSARGRVITTSPMTIE